MVAILSTREHTNEELLAKLSVILLVSCVLANVLIVSSDNLASLNFVMFGSKTCPHCKALHDFFSANYQEKSYFFWVEDTTGSNLFYELVKAEINHGLSQNYALAVPQTLVLREGTPIAVVIGEVTSTEFWNQLMLSNATGEVSVYLGSSKSSIVIPNESLKSLLSDLEKSVKPQTQTQASTQTQNQTQPNNNTPFSTIGLVLVVVGVAVLVLYFVKRGI